MEQRSEDIVNVLRDMRTPLAILAADEIERLRATQPCAAGGESGEAVAWRITDGEGGHDLFEVEPTPDDIDWAARYGRKYEPLYLSTLSTMAQSKPDAQTQQSLGQDHVNRGMSAKAGDKTDYSSDIPKGK